MFVASCRSKPLVLLLFSFILKVLCHWTFPVSVPLCSPVLISVTFTFSVHIYTFTSCFTISLCRHTALFTSCFKVYDLNLYVYFLSLGFIMTLCLSLPVLSHFVTVLFYFEDLLPVLLCHWTFPPFFFSRLLSSFSVVWFLLPVCSLTIGPVLISALQSALCYC